MVALFDIDSLMYKCCYMLDSEENISKYDLNDKTEDELVSELAGIGYSRLEKKINENEAFTTQYNLNKLIIDFNNIPEELVNEFMATEFI